MVVVDGWLVFASGWWLLVGGWCLVSGGWWLVGCCCCSWWVVGDGWWGWLMLGGGLLVVGCSVWNYFSVFLRSSWPNKSTKHCFQRQERRRRLKTMAQNWREKMEKIRKYREKMFFWFKKKCYWNHLKSFCIFLVLHLRRLGHTGIWWYISKNLFFVQDQCTWSMGSCWQ